LGGIGRIGHRITTASLHDRLESLDGRPKIGQLIIVFISGQQDTAMRQDLGGVLSGSRLLVPAVRVQDVVDIG
jgi:hypothetical protein